VNVDPFQVPKGSKNNTFLNWLLDGPYTYVVDVKGLRYYSELERIVSVTKKDEGKTFPKDYWSMKVLFEKHGSKEKDIHGKILIRWKTELVANTDLGLSETQVSLGVNVLGWHFGLFEQGFSAFCVFSGLKSTGIDVKATILYDAEEYTHNSDRIAPEDLTRSPRRPINIVVANADYVPQLIASYPADIWRTHYNIGPSSRNLLFLCLLSASDMKAFGRGSTKIR
jgi:hypothetical protein